MLITLLQVMVPLLVPEPAQAAASHGNDYY